MLRKVKQLLESRSIRLASLVILIMAALGISGGRFIFVKAYNSQVNIYPGAYSLEQFITPDEAGYIWENVEQAFYQDLSNEAAFDEFNNTNSANLFSPAIKEKPVEEIIPENKNEPQIKDEKATFTSPEIEDPGSLSEDTEDVINPDEETGDSIDKPITIEPEVEGNMDNNESDITEIEEPGIPEPDIINGSDGPVIIEENEGSGITKPEKISALGKVIKNTKFLMFEPILKKIAIARARAEATTTDDNSANDTTNFLKEEKIFVPAAPVMLKQSLIFSDFSVPLEYQENGLGEVNLRLSLAAKSDYLDDVLLIEYAINGDFYHLATLHLFQRFANVTLGDYFRFPLGGNIGWEDFKNLRIKVTYYNQDGIVENKEVAVFLDAIWLEVNCQESQAVFLEEATGTGEVLGVLEQELSSLTEEAVMKLLSEKTDFENYEKPEFSFQYKRIRSSLLGKLGAGLLNIFRDEYKDLQFAAVLVDNDGHESGESALVTNYLGDGLFRVALGLNERQFRPGKFSLKIKIIDNGRTYIKTQDFTWGVLAYNSNKSIYQSGEEALLMMGVLDDNGHTLCQADLFLEVTAPDGGIARLNTDNGLIQRNPNCNGDTVIKGSDYEARYITDGLGEYQIKLTAVTDNGSKTIHDRFEVRDYTPLEIERIGPTRIFPLVPYIMTFKILAQEDFEGIFQEFVPLAYIVSNNASNKERFFVANIDGGQALNWPVDWQAGESYELSYTFDAPDISPQFYFLGPAQAGAFAEIRQWQIAADDTGAYDANDGTYTGTWTTPGNAWNSSDDNYAIRDIERRGAVEENTHFIRATSSNVVDLGYTINNVYIGVEGYVQDTNDVTVRLRPFFDGTAGDQIYDISGANMGSSDDDQTDWIEITSDANGPGVGSWDWDDLISLDIKLWGLNTDNGGSRNMWIDQIRIQVDYTVPNDAPTSTIISAVQKSNGSGAVDIEIEVGDADGNNTQAILEYESGSACSFSTPLDPTLDETDASTIATYGDPKVENDNYYQIGNASGYIETATGSNRVYFDWSSMLDVPSGDGLYCARLWVYDSKATSTAATTTLTIDNVAPGIPGSLIEIATSGTAVTLGFGASSTDSNFSEYKIYYQEYDGTSPLETDDDWTSADDSNLLSSFYNGATTTTITNLFPSTQYIFNIWVYDQYGNKASATVDVIATTSAQLVPPISSINSLAQKTDGSGVIDISLEVDDGNNDDVRVRMDYVAGSACNFSPPLDPTLDETDANITADNYDPVIDNAYPYQIGTTSAMIVTATGSNTVLFDWLTQQDVPTAEGVYCVQFTANDTASGDQTNPATSTLIIDNVPPSTPGPLLVATTTSISVKLEFSATSSDPYFSEYRIYYKAGSYGVTMDDSIWSSINDSNLGKAALNGATTTTITGLVPDTQYVFKVWAFDVYGNMASSSSETTATTKSPEPIRSRTVVFLAGTYSGNGSAGQLTDTNQQIPAFNFRLAESDVEIKNAYIILEAQFESYVNNVGNYTYNLAFDVCQETCSADAFSGSGRVLKDDNNTLAYDESESNQVRLLLNVTNETQLAAYTGNGVQMEGRVGYRFERGAAVNSISYSAARLVITYSYNENNSESYTNTVYYPIDSTNSTDRGTRQAIQLNGCSLDTNCPLFQYKVAVPEIGTRLSQWFKINMQNEDGNQTRTDDTSVNVNIEGQDINSYTFYHENALAGSQGLMPDMFFGSVYGFTENATQTLEVYVNSSEYDYYLIGGEVTDTYTASTSAGTKTRTVSFPFGVVNDGNTTSQTSVSVNVYFPENGSATGTVEIKSAWIRIKSSNYTAGAASVAVATQVGNNPQSGTLTYNYSPSPIIIKPALHITHIIPTSDYAELADADIDTAKAVTVYTTNSTANQGGLSAELMITYAYTDEANGYLVSHNLFAGQSDEAGNARESSTTIANLVLSEQAGTKTMLKGALLTSYLMSDSSNTMPGANFTLDANIATTSPTCTNAYISGDDSQNAYAEFYKDVSSALVAIDGESYYVCYSNNGGGDATAGAKMNSQLIYTYLYIPPPPEFTQNDWRWYENIDGVEPTTAKAGENTAATNIFLAEDIRLRINVKVTKDLLATSSQVFKLQYTEATDCPSATGWAVVGGIGSGEPWEGYNNLSVGDGADASTTLLTTSMVVETYEESNPSLVNYRSVPPNGYGEWDWALYNNNATSSSDYCFRLVKSDDTPLEYYDLNAYPVLTTAASNTAPNDPGSLGQFRINEVTVIANAAWTNESEVRLKAAVTDPDINEDITLYFELIGASDPFTTATSEPAGFCYYGTPYSSCGSNIWAATSTTGDYRISPFIATTSITAIPAANPNYKWQVLACDNGGQCSDWVQPGASPNFRIDYTPPTDPGPFTELSKTATTMTLIFGATTTEANFNRYRVYYKQGWSGVTESDTQHNDSSLLNINFNYATTTTVSPLAAGTGYTFKIWAYDYAGNESSSTEFTATTTSSFTPPTGSLFTVAQKTNGSGAIDIAIQVDDPDNDDTLRARIFYEAGASCSFAAENDMTIDPTDTNVTAIYGDPKVDNDYLYQVGTTSGWIVTSPGSNFVFFDWLSQNEEPSANGTYCLGLVVNDGGRNQITTSTKLVIIDNSPPSTPGALSEESNTFNSITVDFGGFSNDPRFDRYRIFYSTSSPVDVGDFEHTKYFGATSTDFKGISSTTIDNLEAGTTYYINIWAFDLLGNNASSTAIIATTNSLPYNVAVQNQYLDDDTTLIPNDSWITESNVKLGAMVFDPDTSELLTHYFQFIPNASLYATATSQPSNACVYGFDYNFCTSTVWFVASSSPGDYSVSPYRATTSITSIPDATNGYKWQVLTCDDAANCANQWVQFNAVTPNFKVDTIAPTSPGIMSENSKTARTVTLNFDAASTETNFREYIIYYSTTSPVTEADYAFSSTSDSNLANKNYGSAATTTLTGLSPDTTYYINIWAYDQAGQKASSTEISIITDPVYSTPGVFFYTRNSRTLYYQVWDGLSWGTEQGGATLGSAAGDNIRHIRSIRSDDGSRVLVMAKTWDGVNQEWWATIYRVAADDFVNTYQLGSAYNSATNNQLITGCLASLSGGEFFIVRNNNGSNGTLVYSWNATDGWTAEGAGPDPVGVVNGCQLVRRPDTDNYLLITFDDTNHGGQQAGDVGTAYYYGGPVYSDTWSIWTEHSTAEEDLDNYVGEAFFDSSNNTRGLINYSNSYTTANTRVKKFICDDNSINYGAAATSPTTWSGDFLHGELSADPGGVGIAYYAGDDVNGEINIFKVSATSSTPVWYTPTNGDNINNTSLYTYTNDSQKPYAIIFYKDGYGLVGWNQSVAAIPKYRVFYSDTNMVDTASSSIPGASTDIYSRVRFYKDPNENEFIAIYQSDAVDYYSVFWDGENNRFYNTTDDPGSAQVWTSRVTSAAPADYDHECTAFSFTAGNAVPDTPYNLTQYRSDASTTISNGAWTTESTVKLEMSVRDSDTSEIITFYLQLIANNDDFATSTGVPQNSCASTTVFTACNSKIWAVATSSAGDYSINPFVATTTITAIPDSSLGYKWQVKACDDSNTCTSWTKYNATTPNFKVDTIAPTAPGSLTVFSKTSNSVKLNFGATSTEDNFDEYIIYYKTSVGVTESDSVWDQSNDGNLANKFFNNTSSTTVTGLSSTTQYWFNIWVYDLAGNKASATPEVSTTTSAGPNIRQTSFLIENDDSTSVNNNTAEVLASTTLTDLYIGERINVRIQIENNGGDVLANTVYLLQFENKTDSPGTWNNVGAATAMSYSFGLSGANGAIIVSSKAVANTNSWINGSWHEDTAQTANFTIDYGEYSELVFSVKTSNALLGKTYQFRLYDNTLGQPLQEYLNYASITTRSSDDLRYSKGVYGALPGGTSNLTYYLDPEGYADVAVNDGNRDVATSSSNIPVFNFAVSSSTDTDALTASWNGQSTVAASTNNVFLQIYRFGSTNSWVIVATNTTAAADTDFTLSANINSNLSEYYDGSNWSYWRVYQVSGIETLKSDYFNIAFTPPVPETKQAHYRWREDNNNEATASWLEAEDAGSPTASTSVDFGENVRLRLSIANWGGGDATDYNYQIEYASTTGNCSTDPGFWATIPTNENEHWRMSTSTFFGDGDPTTEQLTSDGYFFIAGDMVEDPSGASGNITISEDQYTEVEYVIRATANAVAAGTYCFRITNSGTALDEYDIYPVLTLAGVTNTSPFFTINASDNGSASTSEPTNYGSNVTFTATANDNESDDYYLAICQTGSVTVGNDAPPTCNSGSWCISDLASSTEEASCSYTTATSSELLPWYAFACDKYAGFAVGKCSTSSLSTGSLVNDSPFSVNHPPIFTAVATVDDDKDPGGVFSIQTTSVDTDIASSPDALSLYVCRTDAAGFSGCTGGPSDTICSAVATSSPNATCYYTDTSPTPAGDNTYYAYIFDSHNMAATTNSISNTYTINNVAPSLGLILLNNGSDITVNIKPSTTTVQTYEGSIVDQNGCTDLVSAIARIYMSNAAGGSNCSEDDNDCYHVGTSGCVRGGCGGASDPDATYTCTADLEYFAVPTDNSSNNKNEPYNWLSYMQVYDGQNYVSTTSLGVELKTTLGLAVVEDEIDFGSGMNTEENTGSDNATTTIMNIGNSPIDSNLKGTNMIGIPSGTLTVDNIKWATSTFDYISAGTPLTPVDAPAYLYAPKATTTNNDVTDQVLWGIGIPFGAAASAYTGQNTFTAYVDGDSW